MPLGTDSPRSSQRPWCGARPRTSTTHSGKPECVRLCGVRHCLGNFAKGTRDAFLCARAHDRTVQRDAVGCRAAAVERHRHLSPWLIGVASDASTHRIQRGRRSPGASARSARRAGRRQAAALAIAELGRFSVRRRPTRPPQRPRRHCQRRCRRRCPRRHPRRRSRLRRHQRPRIMIVSRIKGVFVSARTRNCGCRCTALRAMCARSTAPEDDAIVPLPFTHSEVLSDAASAAPKQQNYCSWVTVPVHHNPGCRFCDQTRSRLKLSADMLTLLYAHVVNPIDSRHAIRRHAQGQRRCAPVARDLAPSHVTLRFSWC